VKKVRLHQADVDARSALDERFENVNVFIELICAMERDHFHHAINGMSYLFVFRSENVDVSHCELFFGAEFQHLNYFITL
jgi:hypothetical protein